jgi:hypothetical protein
MNMTSNPVFAFFSNLMHLLKLIFLTIFKWAEQVLFLPQTVAIALKENRQRNARKDVEAERLDRIRNPSKYLGL